MKHLQFPPKIPLCTVPWDIIHFVKCIHSGVVPLECIVYRLSNWQPVPALASAYKIMHL